MIKDTPGLSVKFSLLAGIRAKLSQPAFSVLTGWLQGADTGAKFWGFWGWLVYFVCVCLMGSRPVLTVRTSGLMTV